MSTDSKRSRINRRTAIKAAGIACAMFAFGYALLPLYNLACQLAGLNGKTGRLDAAAVVTKVPTRTITVEFTGNATTGLPWEFRPLTQRIEVHPGETTLVRYYVHNTAGESVTGQAVASVVPARAAPYF